MSESRLFPPYCGHYSAKAGRIEQPRVLVCTGVHCGVLPCRPLSSQGGHHDIDFVSRRKYKASLECTTGKAHHNRHPTFGISASCLQRRWANERQGINPAPRHERHCKHLGVSCISSPSMSLTFHFCYIFLLLM